MISIFEERSNSSNEARWLKSMFRREKVEMVLTFEERDKWTIGSYLFGSLSRREE